MAVKTVDDFASCGTITCIIAAQYLHTLYVAPRTVATVHFIGTSETKDIPHSDETRLDGPLCDELSTGCRK